ncbi:hypothetical protein [Rubinisphaera brasiliensis]|uniref:Uncharacterized protein n=1 Tax=Rubinisphaera brasiliensis (strain ATCC 49424 / DSM 5305 / JCM 21570 / IAM 15109 / NBRC 103401 / IFAM 1448) TaxID=756272 RepID=F0SPH4_RUBBR|nr:hypothetical protein [Rubinisphaera brasiliensis]ADY57878.1 hypothetical protein Plabr_0249 [Rubinisphaera brasiliensis DSM 5305]
MQVVTLLFKALSPITHMMGNVGNKTVIRTMDVRTNTGTAKVPVISSNALRHKIREAWADSLGYEEITKREANTLYSGGAERSAGGGPSLKVRQEIQDLLPGIALFGTCSKDDVICGSAAVDHATLVCRESRYLLGGMHPDLFDCADADRLAPSSHFVSDWQYYRHDPVHAQGKQVSDEEGNNTSMPFGGNCVIPGSLFLSQVRIKSDDPVLLGCALASLERWQSQGGVLGGMGSKGHGRLSCRVAGDTESFPAAVEAFHAHAAKNKDLMRGLIGELAK